MNGLREFGRELFRLTAINKKTQEVQRPKTEKASVERFFLLTRQRSEDKGSSHRHEESTSIYHRAGVKFNDNDCQEGKFESRDGKKKGEKNSREQQDEREKEEQSGWISHQKKK